MVTAADKERKEATDTADASDVSDAGVERTTADECNDDEESALEEKEENEDECGTHCGAAMRGRARRR